RKLAHLHGETSANAALALDSRSSTCPPPPGMASLVQVRPPLPVWNRYGANTNPVFAVAKATSVPPGRPGSPMRAIGAATLPRRRGQRDRTGSAGPAAHERLPIKTPQRPLRLRLREEFTINPRHPLQLPQSPWPQPARQPPAPGAPAGLGA